MTWNEFGKIFNAFFEELIWKNYGGALFTILGRDIVVFVSGYLTHLILEALIEIVKEKKK